jgi:hypothetical protein
MKHAELKAFVSVPFLRDGHEDVLSAIRPAFDKLIADLIDLPDDADLEHRLALFQTCLEAVNQHEVDIETIERETILGTIYSIGDIVGLDEKTQYAERWRGDW